MRKKLAAGNWKMNMTPEETGRFIEDLKPLVKDSNADVALMVPYVDIKTALDAAKDSNIEIGAQNMHFEESGAFTGEISPVMLKETGVKYVIIGHSERREYFAETDETVNKKVLKALEYDLIPIMCCGETLTQREQGITIDHIRKQIKIGLLNVSSDDIEKVVIAYEPIWAIGTGVTATSEQAQEVCAAIRDTLRELYGEKADNIRILYGGSVKGENASELFGMPDIDGGLVGGASLKLSFADIVNYDK